MIASELENTKRISLNGPFDFFYSVALGLKTAMCCIWEMWIWILDFQQITNVFGIFDLVFETGIIINFSYSGNQSYSFKPEKVQRYKIISVKLNFNRPNLTLQIDETSCNTSKTVKPISPKWASNSRTSANGPLKQCYSWGLIRSGQKWILQCKRSLKLC